VTRKAPVIVEAAINGNTPKASNPHVPRTPAEITMCALECLDRGAAIVHNHNDEPNIGGPARHDHAPYAEAWAPVLAKHPDALLHPTVRGMSDDAPIAERYAHLDALHGLGLLPMASADPGVVSIGPYLYGNSAADADYMFAWCRERDLPVHLSVFEPGFLRVALKHLARGTLPSRVKVQLYFGGAIPFGLPPNVASLDAYVAMLDGSDLPWMAGVIGGDVLDGGFAQAVIRRGGHLRVGLEDFHGAGTPTNEELVVAATAAIRGLGHEVATSEQALQLLSAPRRRGVKKD
jgi:3-keto-5-aminohexanoate cleavage enzyme